RRRAHHKLMRFGPFPSQSEALRNAEAMLLVDHGEAERAELHVFLEQRMGTDCDRRFSRGNGGERGFPLLPRLASGEPRRFQPQGAEPLAELAEMLLGENFR